MIRRSSATVRGVLTPWCPIAWQLAVCDWIQLISARSQVVYKREQELSGWHNMEEEAWKAGDTEHRGRPGNH